MMPIVLFVLYLFYKAGQISEPKQLNRSKTTSYFLEEVKRKSEDDFGNSIGDKNTRSSEMKSKFQREQRISSFSKGRKQGKSAKCSGKFISLPNQNSWKAWSKVKSGMRILWNPAKSRYNCFHKQSSVVDIWQGFQYASNSEYARVTQNSE